MFNTFAPVRPGLWIPRHYSTRWEIRPSSGRPLGCARRLACNLRWRERFQGNSGIGESCAIDARTGGDECASLHVIRRSIDTVEGNDPAGFEVHERKTLRSGLASQDEVIVTDGQSDRLQAQVVL